MEQDRRTTWTPMSVVVTALALVVVLVLAVLLLRPLLSQGPTAAPSSQPTATSTSSTSSAAPTTGPSADEALCGEVITATRTVFADYPGGNDDLDAAGSARLDAAVTALGDVCASSTDAAFQRDELLPWLNGAGVQPTAAP